MRFDDGKLQIGETLVLKGLVCNQPLWLLAELGYKLPRGKMDQHSMQLHLRHSSYALILYLKWRTNLDQKWNPYLK